MTGHFNYRPLENDSIRLVRIDDISSDPTEPITCRLEYEKFLPDHLPVYFALSYSWGSTTDLKSITINGQQFSVTRNLYNALYQIRAHAPHFRRIVCRDLGLQSWDVWLWVDAVCINQEDFAEKSCVVPQMNKIYSSAYNVLIWLDLTTNPTLGFEPDGLSSFFHHAHKASPIDPRFQQAEDLQNVGNSYGYAARQEYATQMLFYTASKIVGIAWFKRMWVVQEYALSVRKPWVLLGAGVFTLEGLSEVVNRVLPQLIEGINDKSLRETMATRLAITKRRFSSVEFTIQTSSRLQSPEFMNWTFAERLLFLLANTRERLCSEPHDYIYGLLGMVAIPPPIKTLEVDYAVPFGQVCHNYAGYLCEQTGNLAILDSTKRHRDYASWIPDFSGLKSGPPSLHPLTRNSMSWNLSLQELSVEGAQLSIMADLFQFEDGIAKQLGQFYNGFLAAAARLQQQSLQSVFDEWIRPFMISFGSDTLHLSIMHLVDLAQRYCDGKWEAKGQSGQPEELLDEPTQQARLFTINLERFLKAASFAMMENGEIMFVTDRDLLRLDGSEERKMAIWAMKGTRKLTILRREVKGYHCMGWCFPLRGLEFPSKGLDLDDEYFENLTIERITLI